MYSSTSPLCLKNPSSNRRTWRRSFFLQSSAFGTAYDSIQSDRTDLDHLYSPTRRRKMHPSGAEIDLPAMRMARRAVLAFTHTQYSAALAPASQLFS